MNTRSEWVSNGSDSKYYSPEEIINEVKENFDIRRYYSAEGADVFVDGVNCIAIVQYFSNPLNKAVYDRELHVPIDIDIHTGSLIDYKDSQWLVTGNVDNLQAYKSAGIVEIKNTLTYYKNAILFNIPCIINKGNISEETNRFMTLATDEYMVCTPYNIDTANIDKNTRFILSGSAYGVVGVDNISQNGLLWIRVKERNINTAEDNMELGIADYYSNQIIKEVNILNGTSSTLLYTNATLQLNIECKENGVVVSNPTVTYESNDAYVCAVSNTGLITAHGTGDAIVTVRFGNASDTITIHSDMIVNNGYNVVITPSDTTIKANRSLTFNAVVTNNGINDIVKQLGFIVSNVDGSSNKYVTYVINGNSITISAGSTYNKFINIKAYMLAYPDIFENKQIKIVSMV